jgi:hypothetical protein
VGTTKQALVEAFVDLHLGADCQLAYAREIYYSPTVSNLTIPADLAPSPMPGELVCPHPVKPNAPELSAASAASPIVASFTLLFIFPSPVNFSCPRREKFRFVGATRLTEGRNYSQDESILPGY